MFDFVASYLSLVSFYRALLPKNEDNSFSVYIQQGTGGNAIIKV